MKSVIITGTSKGIGLETALAFGKAGYKVYATMRDPKTASVLRQKCKDENLSISIVAMDVDSDDSVEQCIDGILMDNGPVDVLVNNAGIERHGSIEELTLPDFKSVMETNYFGVVRCIKALLPEMSKKRSGCIINVSSVAGQIAFIPFAAYNASKFALEALSEALAGEVKPFNIRVAVVEPGIINTQMAQEIGLGNSVVNPQAKRFVNLYAALLKTAVAPSVVAEKILEIAESDTQQFRHAASPDALPFLEWRKSMTDEQWIDWHAMNDKDWYPAVESTFGLNLKQ
jgi:NAD(P)-dependent dehydrogenase (short-subunit alcohol dehydrogenase family)